ncbi:MAG: flavodoxin family protein [Treponemataceae bacterium]
MKVAAFNGSPNKEGNTFHALRMVTAELESQGIETEIVHVGGQSVKGCIACGACRRNKDEKCVLTGDGVNGWIQIMKGADGILLGSPVHYSGISATMKSFLDRAFYVSGSNENLFRHKVGAGVIAVRRSGGMPSFQQLNNYLLYSEMLIPTSNYWNVIHGRAPGEAAQDAEGVQIMRVLGLNMAWSMKLVAAGKGVVSEPEREDKIMMNFIR